MTYANGDFVYEGHYDNNARGLGTITCKDGTRLVEDQNGRRLYSASNELRHDCTSFPNP
jgi:hypothetical protein